MSKALTNGMVASRKDALEDLYLRVGSRQALAIGRVIQERNRGGKEIDFANTLLQELLSDKDLESIQEVLSKVAYYEDAIERIAEGESVDHLIFPVSEIDKEIEG